MDAIEKLVAEADIARLFHSYFDRVDADDPLGAAEHMTEDVEFEIMIGDRRQGRDRYGRALGRVLAGYTATSHHVSNLMVDFQSAEGATVDGTPLTHASARMYVYAFHRMANTGEPWHLWARIDDRVVRTDAGWRIAEHLVLGMDAIPMRPDIPRSWYVEHPGRLSRPNQPSV